MLQQMIRAGRLDRSFYTKLLFDDYATGNAVAIIVLVFAVPVLVGESLHLGADPVVVAAFSVTAAARAALDSVIRAGISAIAAWAVATRLLGRDGRIPVTFRLTGYAHVAFLPMLLWPVLSAQVTVLLLASAIWYFLAMRVVAEAQFDLTGPEALQVAGAALAAWYLAFLLFS